MRSIEYGSASEIHPVNLPEGVTPDQAQRLGALLQEFEASGVSALIGVGGRERTLVLRTGKKGEAARILAHLYADIPGQS